MIADAAATGVGKATIDAAINTDPDLALLADLANLDTHVALNKPPRSGSAPKIATARGEQSGSGAGGWTLRVEIQHAGRVLDGVSFAQSAVAAWQRQLAGWGLI